MMEEPRAETPDHPIRQMSEHPITPPPEMVEKWKHAAFAADDPRLAFIWAARWGADRELEACIDAIARHPGFESPELFVEVLRATRRPQPLSLKQQALEAPESLGGMNDKLHRDLDELHSIACAAAHALKCVDVMLDSGADEDGYTYEDAAGCVYTIKRAIHVLDQLIKGHGLKGDPLYPDMLP